MFGNWRLSLPALATITGSVILIMSATSPSAVADSPWDDPHPTRVVADSPWDCSPSPLAAGLRDTGLPDA